MTDRRLLALAWGVTLTVAGAAVAQQLDPRRPMTLSVGAPAGPATMARVDSDRSGRARDSLPAAPLSVAWKKMVAQGRGIDSTPLVLAGGEVFVVTHAGDAVWLTPDGAETARLALSTPGGVGAPVSLSGGTLVVVGANAEAIGFDREGIRFRTRLGTNRAIYGNIAPLAVPDGGVIVATSDALTLLDQDGGVRASARAPEAMVTSLLAARDLILAIGSSGVVYGWWPGRPIARVGSLGGVIDGGAALVGPHTLVAMIEAARGSRLVSLDLTSGTTTVRARSPLGAYLGPPALLGTRVYALSSGAGHHYVVSIDNEGQEHFRSPIPAATGGLPALPDGGAGLETPPHTGLLVDASGALAFASPDGGIGVVDATGALTMLPEPSLCGRSDRKPLVVGLAPAGPGAFVVACASGLIAKIVTGR